MSRKRYQNILLYDQEDAASEDPMVLITRQIDTRTTDELEIQGTIQDSIQDTSYPATLLVDSGCSLSCIDRNYVRRKGLRAYKLSKPLPAYNADGTPNEGGTVTHYVRITLRLKGHEENLILPITTLSRQDIFLGLDWLGKHNPTIDWATKKIAFPNGIRINAFQTTSTRIAAAAKKEEVHLPDQYKDFADIFDEHGFDELPPRRPWDHAIDLKPGAEPRVRGKTYPLSSEEQIELDKFLDENLRTGRIRPSKSPIASPFFFVKKKDGKLRPVQDYRKLNDMTIKNRYPLPLISELMTSMAESKFFTKFDIRWGFNNVRIKDGDEWKAAFITNRGLFEPLVMFFGLTNSPPTFQTMIDHIFGDMVRLRAMATYMDDLCIHSKTLEEHRKKVREVLERLRTHRLFLRLAKCQFEKTEIDFLGVIVGNGQIKMDPLKVKAVADWPQPKNLRETRSFMQFCNFYRNFIPNFADITRPFNELTRKDKVFEWGNRQQTAFNELKTAVCDKVTLMFPIEGAPFRLETDASDFAVGAVLHQIVDGKSRPLGFFSKTMGEAERNYQIYDKELLAVMLALQNWRHFLMGNDKFEIWTDHKNLQYFREPQKLNRRQARWFTELSNYNFDLKHKPGSLNIIPDALTRRPDLERGVKDNENIVLLEPERFNIARLAFRDEEEILEEIRRRRSQRDLVVAQGLLDPSSDFRETNGIVEYKGLVYVPRDKNLRERILYAHHDTPVAGHPGRHKTAELIRRSYWWPNLPAQVARYVSACPDCQLNKPRHGAPHAPLRPHDIPDQPWEVISIDLIGPLPESKGYDAILVIVDRLTKMIRVAPTTVSLSAKGTAALLRDHVFRSHGIPRKIISDRGTQFTATFTRDLYRLLGIEQNLSTAYHPQTDGQTERFNAEIEKYLRSWINDKQDDWVEWLALAEFAINNRTNATGTSAFYLNYGRDPNTGTNTRRSVKNEEAQQFAARMTKTWENAKDALRSAADHMKHDYDKRRSEARDYAVGDRVWLEATNIAELRASKKLSAQRYGPFRITKKVGPSAYRLALPAGWKAVHPVFNENLLSPWTPPEASHQGKPVHAPQILQEGGKEHEVDRILDSRLVRGQQQYLVRWKGYTAEHDTWEPEKNLQEAQRKLTEFRHGTTVPARRPPRNRSSQASVPKIDTAPARATHRGGIKGLLPVKRLTVTPVPALNTRENLTTGVDYSLPDPDFLRKYFSPRNRPLFDPYPGDPRRTFKRRYSILNTLEQNESLNLPAP